MRSHLVALALLAPAAAVAESAPALDAEAQKKTIVCTDGKSHYIAVAPHEQHINQLFYGDGKTFYAVPSESGGMLSGDHFKDPRYFNPSYNPSFRGLDIRTFSIVEADAEKKTCHVTCGERRTDLTLVEPAKAAALLAAAAYKPTPRQWKPVALERDTEGTYYYVDQGYTSEAENNYRLFVGPKGNLKQQKMTNVVADSEGRIFATKTGSLRLILGKPEASWVRGKKQKKLLDVPVEDNLRVIYNELGVYSGVRLGTPCDDL